MREGSSPVASNATNPRLATYHLLATQMVNCKPKGEMYTSMAQLLVRSKHGEGLETTQ